MGVHVPRRRCVGCGRVKPKSELIRIALTDQGSSSGGRPHPGRAVLDRTGTMAGRGAYLCRGAEVDEPAADCLTLATRRGGIARALRRAATIDARLTSS